MSVGEELNGVDVGLVTSKSLYRLAGSDIPKFRKGIAGTRNKRVLVCWVEADAHDIAQVVGKLDRLGACLDVPLHARHVARRGENAAVVDKAAAR